MSSSPLYLAIVVVWLIVLVPMLLRRDSAVHYEDDSDLDAEFDGDVDGDFRDGPDEERADGGADPDAEDGGAEDADDAERDDAGAADERASEPEIGDARPVHAARRSRAPASPRPRGREDEEEPSDEEAAMEAAPPPPAPRHRPRRAAVIARRRRRTSGLTALLALAGIGVAAGLGPWWVLTPPAVLLLGHLVLLREAAKADAEYRAAEMRRRRRAAELRRARQAREEAQAARRAQVIELMERRKEVYDQYTDAHQRAAGD